MRNVKKNREYVTKFETGFLLLLVVFTVFVRLQSTDIPLDRDEGAYAYIAAHLDEGMLPYKDTFDHKPPFIYYLYRTGFTMFGESAQGIRSFTTAYVVITLILLYMMVRTVTVSGFTAMLSALFYSMFINNNIFQGFGSNLEIFTHLPLLLSMFFALDRDKKYMKVSFFVSGFFAATAFFIKTMVAFAAVAPLVYILVMYRGNRLKAS
ncbi:MAG: glycosyltransferase family 39 protein, partial [Spirochaetia bacterium]|nr:glycosyltransferase family 39 protein [Spirochaetia bacterium]